MEIGIELLGYLGISNIYFKNAGGITAVLRPLSFDGQIFSVISSSELDDNGVLVLETKKNTYSITVNVSKSSIQTNMYTLNLISDFPEEITRRIHGIENIFNGAEKRKEQRYEIGLSNWKNFGLLKPECNLIYSGTKKIRVIISNASIHGVMLIGERSFVKIGENITFSCIFTEGKITINGNVVNISPLAGSYFKYSINFIEPISLVWYKAIIHYSEMIENMI